MCHTIDRYASMNTMDLVESVHKMKVKLPNGNLASIEDLPRSFVVLQKPFDTVFKLCKEHIETFRILSDKPLMEAIQDARKKGVRSEKYQPLV
jgi:hypothetical protein